MRRGHFILCGLYKIASPPISIFYARIGTYAPPAADDRSRILIGIKVGPCDWPVDCASRRIPRACRRAHRKEQPMLDVLDVILLAVGLGFFALSVAYAFGCDRL
jgi:hypothetical protein